MLLHAKLFRSTTAPVKGALFTSATYRSCCARQRCYHAVKDSVNTTLCPQVGPSISDEESNERARCRIQTPLTAFLTAKAFQQGY